MKTTFVNSLRVYPGGIWELKKGGFARAQPDVEGYRSIRKEIRNELRNGLLAVKFNR